MEQQHKLAKGNRTQRLENGAETAELRRRKRYRKRRKYPKPLLKKRDGEFFRRGGKK
jgi:hypothetical protein